MALSREEIASRYSKALFEYSDDAKALETVHDEMNALLQAAKENPNLIRILSDPILHKNDKVELLTELSQDLSNESKNFLQFLLEYGRFENFVEIVEAFDALYNKSKNIADGTAITAIALEKEELDKIAQAYAKKHNLAALNLENKVDPSILGGVILRVGDERIDGSIRTKLQKIREQLIENK